MPQLRLCRHGHDGVRGSEQPGLRRHGGSGNPGCPVRHPEGRPDRYNGQRGTKRLWRPDVGRGLCLCVPTGQDGSTGCGGLQAREAGTGRRCQCPWAFRCWPRVGPRRRTWDGRRRRTWHGWSLAQRPARLPFARDSRTPAKRPVQGGCPLPPPADVDSVDSRACLSSVKDRRDLARASGKAPRGPPARAAVKLWPEFPQTSEPGARASSLPAHGNAWIVGRGMSGKEPRPISAPRVSTGIARCLRGPGYMCLLPPNTTLDRLVKCGYTGSANKDNMPLSVWVTYRPKDGLCQKDCVWAEVLLSRHSPLHGAVYYLAPTY